MRGYKAGEWYEGDNGVQREIGMVAGRGICYLHHGTGSICRASISLFAGYAGKRIKDRDGNPVEPDLTEDKLYPVVVEEDGVWVKLEGPRNVSLLVSQATGAQDGAGRICIGFCGGNDINLAPCTRPQKHDHCGRVSFFEYAVFRHHSLINQGTDYGDDKD